ncbi:uncharacterized protein LAESUDRAFT_713798 [Laetiporus sulphureus 93-53]|uniref:Uncharacterized protein n=1 Tax=Laetiporus sulphureus 93-53 TaxID=1314785 RepID=A0A165EFJ9_9APHY|nr:uncharacterized protein LAESUDRAFT_713798 [Laetiporus sulphureus 93-53]KZT06950.1 hypothetical protein LAESUDRAFT_713798 [Laetiporus sulphureus 93-53]
MHERLLGEGEAPAAEVARFSRVDWDICSMTHKTSSAVDEMSVLCTAESAHDAYQAREIMTKKIPFHPPHFKLNQSAPSRSSHHSGHSIPSTCPAGWRYHHHAFHICLLDSLFDLLRPELRWKPIDARAIWIFEVLLEEGAEEEREDKASVDFMIWEVATVAGAGESMVAVVAGFDTATVGYVG